MTDKVIDYSQNLESLTLRELYSLSDLARENEKELMQEWLEASAHTDKINKLITQKLKEPRGE